MAINQGKKFEDRFKKDFLESVNYSWLFRLKDQMSRYKNVSKNPCDFIAYKAPNLFLLEVKSTKSSTFPLKFRQYPLLKEEYDKHIDGVFIGLIIWFINYDKVVYVPFETFEKLKEHGKKSFNVKYIESGEYDCYDVPSKKLRTFMQSDYCKLASYCRGEILNARH